MAWWQSAVIALAGAVVGAGVPGAVTLLVARGQTRRERDMQWRTDRREAYAAFISAAQTFLLTGRAWVLMVEGVRRYGPGTPQSAKWSASLVDRSAAARDRAEAACGRMLLMCPADVVVPAQDFIREAEAEPTAGTLQRQGELLSAFVVAARRDVGLDWSGPRPPVRLPHGVT